MNAKTFLSEWLKTGTGTNLDMVKGILDIINDCAVLNEKQQNHVWTVAQMPTEDAWNYNFLKTQLATYINSCH
jgi:hypothetical protein